MNQKECQFYTIIKAYTVAKGYPPASQTLFMCKSNQYLFCLNKNESRKESCDFHNNKNDIIIMPPSRGKEVFKL